MLKAYTALKAIQNSEQEVPELDFDDPTMMMSMQQGMFLKDGTTAKDHLDEQQAVPMEFRNLCCSNFVKAEPLFQPSRSDSCL